MEIRAVPQSSCRPFSIRDGQDGRGLNRRIAEFTPPEGYRMPGRSSWAPHQPAAFQGPARQNQNPG
jgi:hypothetical protein